VNEPPHDLGERIGDLSPQKRALLEERLRARRAARAMPRLDEREPAQLSFSQELLWMLDRASPGMTAYNVAVGFRLRGPLDRDAFGHALDALVARQSVFRTTYAARGDEAVAIAHRPVPVALEEIDVSATDSPTSLAHAVAERVKRSFDLSAESPFRATLFRTGTDDHVLLIVTHHLVFDGWSSVVLQNDLAALYDAFVNKASLPPPLPASYADFAAWQRQQLSGDRLAAELGYWRTVLDGMPDQTNLPFDRPRERSWSFAGAQQGMTLPPDTLERLRALAQRSGATLYMVLLAAYAAVLHRYDGGADIVIGSPNAARTRAEIENTIGYFANALPVRVDLSGDPSFSELLARVRERALSTSEHREVPVEKLIMELRADQKLGPSPLFSCVLTMRDTLPQSVRVAGLTIEQMVLEDQIDGSAKFDLVLFATERDGLRLLAQYATQLFDEATIVRFLGHLRTVLDAAVHDPAAPLSSISLLTAEERAEREAFLTTPAAATPVNSVAELIDAAAARHADRTALVCAEQRVTYNELTTRASRVAQHLLRLGARPEQPVAIVVDRSASTMIAIVGVLKAGLAYVPVPGDAPAARITGLLLESGATIVLTAVGVDRPNVPASVHVLPIEDADDTAVTDDERALPPSDPDALAYVLFTSGSTGAPKGVAVSNRNLVHYTSAIAQRLTGEGLTALADWQFALVTSLAADLGYTSLFPALCAGATVHVIPSDATTDPQCFADYFAHHAIDVLKITPGHLSALGASRTLPNRWLVLGGEAAPWTLVDEVLSSPTAIKSGLRVLNHYGPTETTVGATTFACTAGSREAALAQGARSVPIGVPLPGVRVDVRDAAGQPAPLGVAGELFIGGGGVAQGYWNRPDLSAERFLPDGLLGIAYRTGDRVRRLRTGDLEFLGRYDEQVKIRGFRVEPGEIGAFVRAQPGVTDATVVASEDPPGEFFAYVVPQHVEQTDALREALSSAVAAQLPDYMLPSVFVMLPALPRTPSGKVDRRALPLPQRSATNVLRVAPRNDLEAALVTIWSETFKREPETLSVTDDFFSLGGHSLFAIRILGRISRTFGVRLPLRTLFDEPTIARLAETIEFERRMSALEQIDEGEAAALTGAHEQPPGPA